MVLMAVSYTEENYSKDMNRQLDDMLNALDRGLPFHLDQDMALDASLGADGQPPLPAWLGPLRPGFQEAYRDDREFHVMVRDADGKRYVLLLDQEELDRREDVLKFILAAAFVLSVMAAWGLGLLMARRVIAPVIIRLAGQVQQREQLLPAPPQLAADYPPDEVGTLAAAFDATLGELRQAGASAFSPATSANCAHP